MKKGFTLIEILVVIAIIASIIAMAIPNYLSARQRAQDIKTKSEMVQLKNALLLYYNDYNKYPPSAAPGKLMGCGAAGTAICDRTVCATVDFAAGGTGCDNIYMKQLPTGLGSSILYTRTLSGDDFCLRVVLNNKSDTDSTASQNRCATSCGASCPVVAGSGRYCVCAD
jgi:prepilin-type N-terminal cleavage/methylation domain-containing protein